MNGQNRKDIKPGLEVYIVQKQDQRTGKRTRGIVKEILTSSAHHPHGIKVRLESGEVGRVQELATVQKFDNLPPDSDIEAPEVGH